MQRRVMAVVGLLAVGWQARAARAQVPVRPNLETVTFAQLAERLSTPQRRLLVDPLVADRTLHVDLGAAPAADLVGALCHSQGLTLAPVAGSRVWVIHAPYAAAPTAVVEGWLVPAEALAGRPEFASVLGADGAAVRGDWSAALAALPADAVRRFTLRREALESPLVPAARLDDLADPVSAGNLPTACLVSVSGVTDQRVVVTVENRAAEPAGAKPALVLPRGSSEVTALPVADAVWRERAGGLQAEPAVLFVSLASRD